MKIPGKVPKLQFLRPKLVLALLFLALLAFEVYVLYYKVYGNLSTGVDDIVVSTNIVRLDVNNYKKMLDLLDSNKTFVAPSIELNNPFD